MITYELSEEEAEVVEDILGMWLEGLEEEVPSLAESEEEAHWSLYQLRRMRERAGRLRLRLQMERGKIPSG